MARQRKYPIGDIKVGESTLLPWVVDEFGRRTDQASMNAAIRQEQKRFGKRFYTAATHHGLMVTRLK